MTLRVRTLRFGAALILAGAATIGIGADQPAQAVVAPTHVAIVVAGMGSACVPYHSGMSGADVLSSNYAVTWGRPPSYAGFVVQINGVGKNPPDLTHYWAYYHNAGQGWEYSGKGAANYQTLPGTVEGWAYDDGQQSPPTPPGSSYAAICRGQDPAPPQTHAPTHAPTVVAHSSPPPAAQPGQPAHPNPSSGSRSPNASATSSGARSTSKATRHATATQGMPRGGAAASGDQAESDAGQRAASPGSATEHEKDSSPAPAVGTGLALLAVAGLGGTAFWRLRRQKRGAG